MFPRYLLIVVAIPVSFLFAQSSEPPEEKQLVRVGQMEFRLPPSFQEKQGLAKATKVDAPGRFRFNEGRAYYDPSSAVLLQVYSSDNPLRGSNFKDAQKKFLRDFVGGLTKRSWGLDTMSAVFYPPPDSTYSFWKTTIEGLFSDKEEERKVAYLSLYENVYDAKRNIFKFATLISKPSPWDVYSLILTPGLLVQIKDADKGKHESFKYDMLFDNNDSILGRTGTRSGNETHEFLAFRVPAGRLSEDDAKIFSLPISLLGQPADFWWIIVSSQPTVFTEQGQLYHFVVARFASDDHPAFLDDVWESITIRP